MFIVSLKTAQVHGTKAQNKIKYMACNHKLVLIFKLIPLILKPGALFLAADNTYVVGKY
jgi:hypothetical protein